MPPALQNRPVITGHLVWLHEAYNVLSRFRSWREGIPDPIPLSDILLYLDEVEVSMDSERNDFMIIITEVDSEFIKHFVSKRAAEVEKIKKKK